MHTYIGTYIYTHIYIHIYIYVYICAYVYIYICICIYIYVYTCMHTYVLHIYICTCIHMYIYTYIYTHIVKETDAFVHLCRRSGHSNCNGKSACDIQTATVRARWYRYSRLPKTCPLWNSFDKSFGISFENYVPRPILQQAKECSKAIQIRHVFGNRLYVLAYVIEEPIAYVSIRQHTSAYVSIRQHTSAYVSIRQTTSLRAGVEMCSQKHIYT